MKLSHATSYLISLIHFIAAAKRDLAALKTEPSETLFLQLKTRRTECAKMSFRNWQTLTRRSFLV